MEQLALVDKARAAAATEPQPMAMVLELVTVATVWWRQLVEMELVTAQAVAVVAVTLVK